MPHGKDFVNMLIPLRKAFTSTPKDLLEKSYSVSPLFEYTLSEKTI